MAAQKGRDLVLKIDDGTGAFITVAGLRSRQLALNAQTVDITSADSAGQWRELLSGAGVRRASLSGAGVFKDAASDAALRLIFFDGSVRAFQLVVPEFGVLQGPFQVASLDYRGEYAGEVTFDITLESAGALSFTAL